MISVVMSLSMVWTMAVLPKRLCRNIKAISLIPNPMIAIGHAEDIDRVCLKTIETGRTKERQEGPRSQSVTGDPSI